MNTSTILLNEAEWKKKILQLQRNERFSNENSKVKINPFYHFL